MNLFIAFLTKLAEICCRFPAQNVYRMEGNAKIFPFLCIGDNKENVNVRATLCTKYWNSSKKKGRRSFSRERENDFVEIEVIYYSQRIAPLTEREKLF